MRGARLGAARPGKVKGSSYELIVAWAGEVAVRTGNDRICKILSKNISPSR